MEFGSDSVYGIIEGLPIWILDESISIDLALGDTSRSEKNLNFFSALGQNIDDGRLALKLEEVYRAWFASLQETDLSRDRIISQEDRLVLALSNQSSLDRQDILVDELNYLFELRDRIKSNQPSWFGKLLMFFKGWNVIVRNKYEIELVSLKTYYQLNKSDSIRYPQSLILDQTKKLPLSLNPAE